MSEVVENLLEMDVPLTVVLGTKKTALKNVLKMHVGSLFGFDEMMISDVDVYAGDKFFGKAEVMQMDEELMVRMGEPLYDDDSSGPNEVLSKDEIAALLALGGSKDSDEDKEEKDDSSSRRGLKSMNWYKYLPRCDDEDELEDSDDEGAEEISKTLRDMNVTLSAVITSYHPLKHINAAGEGTIFPFGIALQENADIGVDVYANDKKIARGKLVYHPCEINVKITEFVD